MSTGLTFGSISALYGLNHGLVTQSQYSVLVTVVVASAVVPTIIAQAFFMPSHAEQRAVLVQAQGPVLERRIVSAEEQRESAT
jgi:hypothetical protein